MEFITGLICVAVLAMAIHWALSIMDRREEDKAESIRSINHREIVARIQQDVKDAADYEIKWQEHLDSVMDALHTKIATAQSVQELEALLLDMQFGYELWATSDNVGQAAREMTRMLRNRCLHVKHALAKMRLAESHKSTEGA